MPRHHQVLQGAVLSDLAEAEGHRLQYLTFGGPRSYFLQTFSLMKSIPPMLVLELKILNGGRHKNLSLVKTDHATSTQDASIRKLVSESHLIVLYLIYTFISSPTVHFKFDAGTITRNAVNAKTAKI